MSTETGLRCVTCGQTCDLTADAPWRCSCGGLFDLTDFPISLPRAAISSRPATLWRYREALPFASASSVWEAITLGEGMTPLIAVGPDAPEAWLKIDYMMPTLSFKDRGAVVLLAKAREMGVTRVVADSSGNAGAALAAYAARAGIACEVYVPAAASPYKIRQIAQYGAVPRVIDGTRADVSAAAMAAADRPGWFYASHVYNPLFYQGTKTYAYEIVEQLGWSAPETVILPVGNGTLVLGAYLGFRDLLHLGIIDTLPQLIAVQSAACAPLAAAWQGGVPAPPMPTIAEGIAIAAPPRAEQILTAIRAMRGAILTVDDVEVLAAQSDLARRGLDVEPTGAACWAAWRRHRQAYPTIVGQVVLPLCGAGAKAAH